LCVFQRGFADRVTTVERLMPLNAFVSVRAAGLVPHAEVGLNMCKYAGV